MSERTSQQRKKHLDTYEDGRLTRSVLTFARSSTRSSGTDGDTKRFEDKDKSPWIPSSSAGSIPIGANAKGKSGRYLGHFRELSKTFTLGENIKARHPDQHSMTADAGEQSSQVKDTK
jgi:hypothetical protein